MALSDFINRPKPWEGTGYTKNQWGHAQNVVNFSGGKWSVPDALEYARLQDTEGYSRRFNTEREYARHTAKDPDRVAKIQALSDKYGGIPRRPGGSGLGSAFKNFGGAVLDAGKMALNTGAIVGGLAAGAGALGIPGGLGTAAAGGGAGAAATGTTGTGGLTAAEWANSGIYGFPEATSGGLTGSEWAASGIYGDPVTAGGAAAPAAGAGGAATGAGTAASTPLSRLLGLSPQTSDLLSVLGPLGATGLGMYSANRQGDALENIAAQSRADRAPFLGAATNYLNDPSAYIEGPGQAALKGTLHGLSAKFGNPIGSGAALQFATDAALGDWRNAVTGFGNLGLSGEDSRNQLLAGAAQKDADIFTTLGGGISDVVNPRRSLADMAKEWRSLGLI